MDIYDELAELFRERAYVVKRGDEYVLPDANDIRQMLDGSIGMMYDDVEGTAVTLGRMLTRKNHRGRYDVFLWIGEIE